MDKRKKQQFSANTKAVLIIAIIISLAYCIGLLVGSFYALSKIKEEDSQKESQSNIVKESFTIEEKDMEEFSKTIEEIPDEASKTIVEENDPQPIVEEPIPEEPVKKYYGSCRITAYCSCEKCCGKWANNRPVDENGHPIVYGASGNILTPGVSVACSLPYETEIIIDGLPGTFIVEDRTAEWIQDKYNGMTIDIYMDDHDACYDLLSGKPEWMDVYVVSE